MTKALLEYEAKQLLTENGIAVLDFQFCQSLDEVLVSAKKIGFPVVLKIVSPQVVHKSDAGGVKLNLNSAEEVKKAFAEMMESVLAYAPGAEILGVLVSPFINEARELIIGSVDDCQFGPVVMVGLGGIFVEIFKDVSFGVAPLKYDEAKEMLEGLKAFPIIKGARGQEGLNIPEISQLIVKVSEFVAKNSVKELDLNPVFCFADKVVVGDARIIIKLDKE